MKINRRTNKKDKEEINTNASEVEPGNIRTDRVNILCFYIFNLNVHCKRSLNYILVLSVCPGQCIGLYPFYLRSQAQIKQWLGLLS